MHDGDLYDRLRTNEGIIELNTIRARRWPDQIGERAARMVERGVMNGMEAMRWTAQMMQETKP